MSKHIHLWSGPRNISTALMYSFAQRPDTRVFDEPLYAHYLRMSGVDHPGREEVLREMENDGKLVVRNIFSMDGDEPIRFYKQMTHHLIGLDLGFLESASHIILIREPSLVLNSYAKVIETPDLYDIGIQQAEGLWHYLNERDIPVVVIDSSDLLSDPEQQLRSLCSQLHIPFHPEMLQWEPGPREEDGIWAPYWYGAVHRSTGFKSESRELPILSGILNEVYQEALPIYQRLHSYARAALVGTE